MKPNGPAIKAVCVTRRKRRAGSWYFGQKAVTVQGGYGVVFASHGTKVFEHYACRGTNGRRRYKSVTLLKLNGLHWCGVRVLEPVENFIESRNKCKNHDTCPAHAGSNLPLLSVLALVILF